jgi:uncharacterized membrane protein YkgB
MKHTRLIGLSLGLVYLWFGGLKIAGLSSAHELVGQTAFWMPEHVVMPLLGTWEVMIGLGLCFRRFWRIALPLFFVHMFCTTMPLFVLPQVCFLHFPFVPTLVGQYIVKNLILFSAGYALWKSQSDDLSYLVSEQSS